MSRIPLSCRSLRTAAVPLVLALFVPFVRAEELGRSRPAQAYWQLAPDAEKLVGEMRRQAKAYKPQNAAPALITQAQFKYGLESDSYLHRWYDRPLLQDSSFAAYSERGHLLNPKSWQETVRVVRLGGMAGMAANLSQSGRMDVVARSVMEGGEIPILVELPTDLRGGFEKQVAMARLALKMPNSYRIGGKVVLVREREVNLKDLPEVRRLHERLRAEFGETFVLMSNGRLFENANLPDGPLRAENVIRARDRLREILRASDGFFHCGRESFGNWRYDPAFANEVMVPLIQSVFAEPEFQGRKVLGSWASPGHENTYRWQYVLDSDGTGMLRGMLGTIGRLRPDFALLYEWDEENENTSFRPTFDNGFSTQRIVRYFADGWAKRAPEPFPGDDVSVPNLVLSYRKSLVAGEPIEAEVLNVPDGTFAGQAFEVELVWRNAAGAVVRRHPGRSLTASRLEAVRFESSSAELLGERVLMPALRVKWKGGRTVLASGFAPLALEATRNVDHKWVKQPVRELAQGVKGGFRIEQSPEPGTWIVRGEVSSPVPLRTVEVLEGPDTIWMAGADRSRDEVVVQMQIQGLDCAAGTYAYEGRITWSGGGEIPVARTTLSNWFKSYYATFPVATATNAMIDVDLPPLFKGRIRVADILEKDVVAMGGPGGASFVASRFLSVRSIPPPLGKRSAAFDFAFRPVRPSDVLHLRVSDETHRLWRSASVICEQASGRRRTLTVFDRVTGVRVRAQTDAVRIQEPSYDFGDSSRGDVVATAAGRDLWGILGAKAALVTGFGMGESQYGSFVSRHVKTTCEGWANTQPERVVCDGVHALRFRDCNYATLPQQVVPGFAAFMLEMKVRPERTGRTMGLFSSGNQALEISMDGEGAVHATVFGGRRVTARLSHADGPSLVFGKWNDLKFMRDGESVWLVVNGHAGEKVPFANYLPNSRWTSIGTTGDKTDFKFFRGEIASLGVTLLSDSAVGKDKRPEPNRIGMLR